MKIKTYNAHNINDDVSYRSVIATNFYGLAAVNPALSMRQGKFPVLGGINRPERQLDLDIHIINEASREALASQLGGWLDPDSETAVLLKATDDDGTTNERYLYVICQAFERMPGRLGLKHHATLKVDGDVLWRSVTSATSEWSVTVSGASHEVTNAGDADAYPIYTIKPTAVKTSGLNFDYQRFVAVKWLNGYAAGKYPMDITNGGLDTAALIVTATATTLSASCSSADTTISLTDASSFPTKGMAYITDAVQGNEQILWTGKSTNDLTGVTRGIGGTTAVAHSAGDAVALSKMLANGDDLRVYVNGVEADRWLNGINTATTKIWVNLDHNGYFALTLKTAIAGSGAITEIAVNEDIAAFYSSGILQIESEYFTFTGKDNGTRKFTGVTRAVKGSSEAAHVVGLNVYWIQNEINILYGDRGLSAPTVDADYEPMFLKTSTNTSWDYDDFMDTTKPNRPGSWRTFTSSGLTYTYTHYGGNEYGSFPTTFAELGVQTLYGTYAGYSFTNSCGMTAANFQNGERKATHYLVNWDSVNTGIWSYATGPAWVSEYSVTAPSTIDAWEAWSDNETLATGTTGIMLLVYHTNTYPGGGACYLECADVTVTLNSANTPTATVGAETANLYSIAGTLTNETTSESIEIAYDIPIDGVLSIDTYNKTVTYVADGSNQFQALTLTGGPRRDWLKLAPGANGLTYTETGLAAVTVTIEYAERYYR